MWNQIRSFKLLNAELQLCEVSVSKQQNMHSENKKKKKAIHCALTFRMSCKRV